MGRPKVKPITCPEYSYTAQAILSAYNIITRSRRYENSMPLSLNLSDIESYLEVYESPVEVHIFVKALLAIDDLFLDEAYKKK